MFGKFYVVFRDSDGKFDWVIDYHAPLIVTTKYLAELEDKIINMPSVKSPVVILHILRLWW
jgi:hypothetical protein